MILVKDECRNVRLDYNVIVSKLRHANYDRNFTKLSEEKDGFLLLMITNTKGSDGDMSNLSSGGLLAVKDG